MFSLRAAAALAVICLAMVIADCSATEELLSLLPENPFFPDNCKPLKFPFSYPLPPLINDFPLPTISSMLPFPFSELDKSISPRTSTPSETLPPTVPESIPAE
ncbi:uncharacterized protein LOC111041361 [Myzus persicae]|uniref:uncharacterized protein LOC111041361 n=1 Tax=Myzus persicae TaxID=13164 RepID=UPI000B93344F|nr:uncharacterized protein LOC111041361 [Myzus persicae]